MSFNIFLNFNGNCREAAEFYARAFGQKMPEIMTYGEAPELCNGEEIPDEDKRLVMYCSLPAFGGSLMMADCPSGFSLNVGNNVCLTVGFNNAEAVKGLFNALKDGGIVDMDLQKTFWSDLFGMVTDKFGIIWQICMENDQ